MEEEAEKKLNMVVQDGCCKLIINVNVTFYPKRLKMIGWWSSNFSLLFIPCHSPPTPLPCLNITVNRLYGH